MRKKQEGDKEAQKTIQSTKKGRIFLEMLGQKGWEILNSNLEGDEEGEFTYIEEAR